MPKLFEKIAMMIAFALAALGINDSFCASSLLLGKASAFAIGKTFANVYES